MRPVVAVDTPGLGLLRVLAGSPSPSAKSFVPFSCLGRSSAVVFAHVCTQLFVTVIMCMALGSALQENKKETDFSVRDVCVCNNIGNEYVS